MACGVASGWLLAALDACEEKPPGADPTSPRVPFVVAAGGRDILISPPGADDSTPPTGEGGAPPGSTTPPATPPPPPPLGPPPGTTGGVPLCSGDVDGAGLPTLVVPPELWVGSGVGAGDGSDVELGAVGGGGGWTGGGALVCPPGIGGFVADGVGVQLQVSSGDDGGSLGVGGDEDSDSVDVGCSLGVGCTLGVGCSLGVGSAVSDGVGVGDGSLVEGAGSELGSGSVDWCDGGLVVAGSVDEGGAVVEGGVDDDGSPAELAGRDDFVGGW